MPNYYALIPAAGSGSRLGGELPKQYLNLAGEALLTRVISTFGLCASISKIFVVVAVNDGRWKNLPQSDRAVFLECGGATRSQSVTNGLSAISSLLAENDWILVHDAARPCVDLRHLNQLIDALADDPVGGLLAVPVADTLKRADDRNQVIQTEVRDKLWAAQTPQMFRYGVLRKALATGHVVTDEAQAVEQLGYKPKLIASDQSNLKITYAGDLGLASAILMQKRGSNMRIGQGFDVHAFSENRKCIIGGVTIPFPMGLAGHSDADVLLHAICDGLLGAAGLGDIGHHFPDHDDEYKDADSRMLLKQVGQLLTRNFFTIVNIDATVIAQAPRIAPFIAAMTQNIASDLKLSPDRINIKATTTEHLGFTGRKEGIAASAICLITT